MDKHQEAFREEAYELLAELETSLLELEENPADKEVVGRVFRAMHTIKGSGAMFGFEAIAEFTHEVETAFDLVREEKVRVTPELINLTLTARDQILAMLDSASGGSAVDEKKSKEIIESLRDLTGPEEKRKKNEGRSAPLPPPPPALRAERQDAIYRIRFTPALDIFANGTNPLFLLNELREMGECSVIANSEKIPLPTDYDPEACYMSWDIILTTNRGVDAIRDVFIFVEDDCDLAIEEIYREDPWDESITPKKLGEILLERGDLTREVLEQSLRKQERIGSILSQSSGVSASRIQSALHEQEHFKRVQRRAREKITTSSIRVDSIKLDNLVNLVGELVTVQARLTQNSSKLHNPELTGISEEIGRLTDALRDNTMSIRMLPIGTTFNKFKRLVRDLSMELGKEIELTTDGAETELDKTVIEQLNDPLVHLIRNAIDHGIERPETRETAGKPRQGTIHLTARHVGGAVLIEIADDGAGLDSEIIKTKAIGKGLLAPDANPSEQEIFSLLFAPGFSTAEKVTDISGRGVGMDVVKRGIENLRGAIEISSRQGKGSTITLKLPLTLAIIDGLLVKIDGDFFVIPLAAVEECLELSGREAVQARERAMMSLRGRPISYLSLRQRFRVAGDFPATEKIVISEVNGTEVGLAVDQVIGQHQTVIKSLSDACNNVKGLSGATILGDGTVALILDVNAIVQSMPRATMEKQD